MGYSALQILEHFFSAIIATMTFLLGKALEEIGVDTNRSNKDQSISFWADQTIGGGSRNIKPIDYDNYTGSGEYKDEYVEDAARNSGKQPGQGPVPTRKYPVLARGNIQVNTKEPVKAPAQNFTVPNNMNSSLSSESEINSNATGLALKR